MINFIFYDYILYLVLSISQINSNWYISIIMKLINYNFNKSFVQLGDEIIDNSFDSNLYIFQNFNKYIVRETNMDTIKCRNPCKYLKLCKELILSKFSKYITLKNKLDMYLSLYGNNIHYHNINREISNINNKSNKYINSNRASNDIYKMIRKSNKRIWILQKIKKYLAKIKIYEDNFFKLPFYYTGDNIANIGKLNEEYSFTKLNNIVKNINCNNKYYSLLLLNNINIFKNDYFNIYNYHEIINEIVIEHNFKKDRHAKGEMDAILILLDNRTKIAYVLSIFEFKNSLEGLYKDYTKYYLLICLLKKCKLILKDNPLGILSFNFDKIYKDFDDDYYYNNVYYVIDHRNISSYSYNINKFKLIDFLDISKKSFFDQYLLNNEKIIYDKYNTLLDHKNYLDNKFDFMYRFLGFHKKNKTIKLI